jgi:hypothetical protein
MTQAFAWLLPGFGDAPIRSRCERQKQLGRRGRRRASSARCRSAEHRSLGRHEGQESFNQEERKLHEV